MANNLEKLNRLRVNAGKPELKSWKASGAKLEEAIKTFEDQGFTDALPGADVNAKPITDDPVVAAARPEPDPAPEPVVEPKKPTRTNGKPGLARGLDTDSYAKHSRARVRDHREAEKKLQKGQVDPEKDPEKAERQKKHIEEKQAKRKAEGKAVKPKEKNADEITVAEIARELNIDPKVARAKLRRHEDKISKLHTKGQDRWTFPQSAKADLISILK